MFSFRPGLTCLCPLLVPAILLLHPTRGMADDPPLKIRPEQAREHEGANVSVAFEVKATKDAKHRMMVFLDSESNFQDEKNLGIAISERGVQDLIQKRNIGQPAEHYRNKSIRVIGVVVIREDRVYIDVDEAAQIEEVDASQAGNT